MLSGSRKVWILLLWLAALPACGDGDGGEVVAVHHPLAAKIQAVRPKLAGLGEQDNQALNSFLRSAGPDATPFEVQRVCGVVGKGLRNADGESVADFILRSSAELTTDFFSAFDDEGLARLAAALRSREDVSEIARLRMEAILRRGRGVFQGTLTTALSSVQFQDAVAPVPIPLAEIEPGPEATRERMIGAAEILRSEAFVEEGAKPDLAVDIYRRALENWGNDPVVISGLVSVYLANEDRYQDDLRFFLTKAEELAPQNALYPYLRALRYFRVGRDEEGLAALTAGAKCPMLSLHEIDRARCAAELLGDLGYGRVRALLRAHRAADLGPMLDMNEMANIAIRRSHEYERLDDEGKQKVVLEFPLDLERQVRNAPHMLFAETLMCSVQSKGLTRLADYHGVRTPGIASTYRERAKTAQARLAAIEKGGDLCGGKESWGRLHGLLGDESFLTYIEGVLYGNEAEFLIKCSGLESIEEAKELAVQRYPFE